MTILQLTRILRNYLKVELPEEDVVGLTITNIQGNTVTLSGSTGTTANAWLGGILRITDTDDYINMTVAIAGNSGDTVTISTPFDPTTALALNGASCEIQGGPLRDAIVFHIQPKSIKDLIASGDKVFIYINPLDTATAKRGLGGNSNTQHAARNQIRAFTLQIIGSVPFRTGDTTPAEAYINQTKIYDLLEQIQARLLMFSSLNRFPLSEEFEITTNIGLLEPDGGQKSEIIVMEFGFALAL